MIHIITTEHKTVSINPCYLSGVTCCVWEERKWKMQESVMSIGFSWLGMRQGGGCCEQGNDPESIKGRQCYCHYAAQKKCNWKRRRSVYWANSKWQEVSNALDEHKKWCAVCKMCWHAQCCVMLTCRLLTPAILDGLSAALQRLHVLRKFKRRSTDRLVPSYAGLLELAARTEQLPSSLLTHRAVWQTAAAVRCNCWQHFQGGRDRRGKYQFCSQCWHRFIRLHDVTS
jgi:hypothetical protein